MFPHCVRHCDRPPGTMGVSLPLLGVLAETLAVSIPLGFLRCREPLPLTPLLPCKVPSALGPCGNLKASPSTHTELSNEAALWLNFSIFPNLLPSLPSHRDPKRTA